MPRPRNPTLMAAWKLYMPATLTARVELLLFDPLTSKAKHGERARITTQLWEQYLTNISGREEEDAHIVTIPRLDDATIEVEGIKLPYPKLARLVKEHHDRLAS